MIKVSYDKLVEEFGEIAKLVMKKNHDYGDAWQRYGVFTPLIRINDKILRVMKLSGGQQALVADENIEDTLRDIVGYGMLALLWLKENGHGKPEFQLDFFDLLDNPNGTDSNIHDSATKERIDISKWD